MHAIRVDNVTKVFRLYLNRPISLKEKLLRIGTTKYEEFQALTNVSFAIPRGGSLGLVGANGSGKSTLLKIVAGILQPTSGSVEVKGRVSALLELGSGFQPHYTGRENVYLNGTILGLSPAHIRRRYNDIVEFADIGQFIDLPVRHYSSGMYVRLAFAIAVHVEPEILLVDEVLAVGDEAFRSKCVDRIRDLRKQGTTMLFVSHAASMVEDLCDSAMLLQNGKSLAFGKPKDVIAEYRSLQTLAGSVIS